MPVKGCKFWPMLDTWPFSSEGSLVCNTYCDTGHPFIMVISEDPWHSHPIPSVWQWSCHYLFLKTWICRGWDLNAQPSTCRANAVTHCANVPAHCIVFKVYNIWWTVNVLIFSMDFIWRLMLIHLFSHLAIYFKIWRRDMTAKHAIKFTSPKCYRLTVYYAKISKSNWRDEEL